jgi:hypothetical protein
MLLPIHILSELPSYHTSCVVTHVPIFPQVVSPFPGCVKKPQTTGYLGSHGWVGRIENKGDGLTQLIAEQVTLYTK